MSYKAKVLISWVELAKGDVEIMEMLTSLADTKNIAKREVDLFNRVLRDHPANSMTLVRMDTPTVEGPKLKREIVLCDDKEIIRWAALYYNRLNHKPDYKPFLTETTVNKTYSLYGTGKTAILEALANLSNVGLLPRLAVPKFEEKLDHPNVEEFMLFQMEVKRYDLGIARIELMLGDGDGCIYLSTPLDFPQRKLLPDEICDGAKPKADPVADPESDPAFEHFEAFHGDVIQEYIKQRDGGVDLLKFSEEDLMNKLAFVLTDGLDEPDWQVKIAVLAYALRGAEFSPAQLIAANMEDDITDPPPAE